MPATAATVYCGGTRPPRFAGWPESCQRISADPSRASAASYRVGKAKALTATARKLAILVYRTLKDGLVYQDPGAAAYDAHHRARVIRRLRQRAATLDFTLVDHDTGEVIEGAVS